MLIKSKENLKQVSDNQYITSTTATLNSLRPFIFLIEGGRLFQSTQPF